MKRLTAVLLLCLIPLSAFAQYFWFDADTAHPAKKHVLDRVFSGNTPMIKMRAYEKGEYIDLTDWTMYFRYGYGQYDTNGMVNLQGTVSSNIATWIGATNLFFEDRSYYFSVVGIHTAGYVKTFATGTMKEQYDPAAETNITALLGTINIAWWTNNVGAIVTNNTGRIVLLERDTWTNTATSASNSFGLAYGSSILTLQYPTNLSAFTMYADFNMNTYAFTNGDWEGDIILTNYLANDGGYLTNLQASAIVAGGALADLDAGALTNISAALVQQGILPVARLSGVYNIGVTNSTYLGGVIASTFMEKDGTVAWTGTDNKGNQSVTNVGPALVFRDDGVMRSSTADASDTSYVAMAGGGAFTLQNLSRGASVCAYGNDNVSQGGHLFLAAGNHATKGGIIMFYGGGGGDQAFNLHREGYTAFSDGATGTVCEAVGDVYIDSELEVNTSVTIAGDTVWAQPQSQTNDTPTTVTPRAVADTLIIHTTTNRVYKAFGTTTNDWVSIFNATAP
jgi:hypothetical protein